MKKRAKKSAMRAFTLIELMLVMGMMAILAAATGLALASAMEEGRVSRTQAQIARIHSLLMTRYDTYRTRSVRIFNSAGIQGAYQTWELADQQTYSQQRQIDRLRAIRLIMRLEMPDNLRDLVDIQGGNYVPVYHTPTSEACVLSYFSTSGANSSPAVMGSSNAVRRPTLSDSYFRRIQAAMANPTYGNRFVTQPGSDNVPSECLYLILSSIQDGETNGLDFLLPSEIGDTDQDGIPEILDSWGRPIFFLRWAPAIVSPMQNHMDLDPFDPLHVDPRSNTVDPVTGMRGTYSLTPFVYSAGPDGQYGYAYSPDDLFTYSATQPPLNEANDPFCVPLTGVQWGTPAPSADGSEGFHDNITNHFQSKK